MSFSTPPLYPNFKGNNFNPIAYPSTSNTGLTVQQGQAYFVSFPQAQGKITLLDTNVTGELNTSNNIFLNNTGNYIQFSDGTRQTTATQDFSGYAFTDVSNVFFDLNTFNANIAIGGILNQNYIEFPDGSRQYTAPADDINTVYNDISNTFLSPTIQKFQGSNTTTSSSAPLQFTNVSTGEYGSLFVDPNPNNDLTLYSNQSGGGLTISNPSNSFTINPTNTNTASFLNPIVSNASITGQSLGLNTTGANAYTIYSNTTPVNYGVVIANTTGADGNLTISNNGGTSTTLTSTSTGLSINDAIISSGSVSCTSLTSTGAISGSQLTLSSGANTSILTTASDGLNINDPVVVAGGVSCQAISCTTLSTNNNTITSGAINAGAISGSQLTLSSGANTSILTTASDGLNINDPVVVAGGVSCQAISCTTLNTNNNTITSGAISTTGGIDMNNGSITELNAIQGNGTTKISCNSDFYINIANTLYASTIVPTGSNPIQMGGGTYLATNPASSSNDTTIATTSFVNTIVNGVSFTQTNQQTLVLGGSQGNIYATMFSNSDGINTAYISQSVQGIVSTYSSYNAYYGVSFSTPIYPSNSTPVVSNNTSYFYYTSGSTGSYLSVQPLLGTNTSWDMFISGNVPAGTGNLIMQFTITW